MWRTKVIIIQTMGFPVLLTSINILTPEWCYDTGYGKTTNIHHLHPALQANRILSTKVNGDLIVRCMCTCDSTEVISDNMAGIEKNPIGTMTEMSKTPMES